MRITVQLVKGGADEHLWHESYDGDLSDILAVQERIARSVAVRVEATLKRGESEGPAAERSVVPAAYDAYLRARQLDRVRTGWASPEMIQRLESAVALDPGFGSAHYWLADALVWSAVFQQSPAKELMPRARTLAMTALELGAVEAHGVLGSVAALYDWDWAEARAHFERVRETRPNTLFAVASQQTEGRLLFALGSWEPGLEQMRKGAATVDPIYLLPSAWVHDFEARARRYDVAIKGSKTLLTIDPELPQAYNTLWWAHSWKGEFDEAVAALEGVLRLTGTTESRSSDPYPDASPLLAVYQKAGFRAYLRAWIGGWEEMWKARGVWAPYIAQYYARLGEADLAFEWLERAYQDRNPHLVFVFNAVPDFDPIRSDLRFVELAERVGIPLVEPDGPLAAPLPD